MNAPATGAALHMSVPATAAAGLRSEQHRKAALPTTTAAAAPENCPARRGVHTNHNPAKTQEGVHTPHGHPWDTWLG